MIQTAHDPELPSHIAPGLGRSIFQSPLVIGLVAIIVMTGAIIAFGSSLIP